MTVRLRHMLLPVLLLLLLAEPVGAELPPEQRSRILILNSYHPYYVWSDNEINGIVETLKTADPRTEPIVEYLDCKFFSKMDHFGTLSALFRHKFRGIRIPILIAADNPALEFALKYRDELFPGVPIVFCGINGFEPRMIAGTTNISGVAELLDIRGTIDIMLKLHPGTREIFIIHDYTTTGMATRKQAERDLAGFDRGVGIRYMDNISTDVMLQQVKSLPRTSLVLALSYSRDSEGRVFDHTQIARLLSENSPVPVYAGHEERLGSGVVGGNLLGGKLHGAKAAEMALAVLRGASIERMPVSTEKTTRPMFDHRQLVRFGISPADLPDGSIVINKPASMYEQHTAFVWATCGTITSLAIIIGLLTMNIRQRRRANQELAVKAQQLERANAELQEFTMLSYHDLQEPLRNIGGFVQLLEKRYRGKLGNDANEYIGITVQNVNHMKQLFADLTSYLHLTPREMRPEECDGNELLKEALARVAEQIGSSRAMVTFDPLPQLRGDRNMLVLLLANLISNAVKFSAPHPLVHIGLRSDDRRDTIYVRDNGIGVAGEYHDRIFQIFKKLHHRSTYGGTGIGLSICKRIVELHGGRIWLESETDKGTTFCFTLPRTGEIG